MSASLKPYLDSIRTTLEASLCLRNFPSQEVERHNKPQVEAKESDVLLLHPVILSRDKDEKCLIEASINSVRVSIGIKKADDLEIWLARKFIGFLSQRADSFIILRRKPVEGYDISFLITNFHLEWLLKKELIEFVCDFIKDVDRELKAMKMDVNTRARLASKEFLEAFA